MKQVTAAVIVEDGNVLLTRRAPNCAVPGAWELPGGKIEHGETPQECLERELHEELSMIGTAGEVLARTEYVYSHGQFELIALAFVRRSDFGINPDIHDRYEWVPTGLAHTYHLAPADVALIAALFTPDSP